MQLDRPIAYGRTAEIYPWEGGWVLKLFHTWFPSEAVQYEAIAARAVYVAGLPVPAVGEIIEVDGRMGLLYQRVKGISMWEQLQAKPWKTFEYARILAELHAQMHAVVIPADRQPQPPEQRNKLVEKLNAAKGLSERLHQAALDELANLPAGDRLCHGDFHPGNVLMTPDGMMIIDWIDVTVGSPLADVARTSVLALGAAATVTGPGARLQKWTIRSFHWVYINRYFQLMPGGQAEYHRWMPVVAAARMSEGIAELQEWLHDQARRGLQKKDLSEP